MFRLSRQRIIDGGGIENMAKQVKKANSVNIEDTITTIVINRPSKKSGLTGLM